MNVKKKKQNADKICVLKDVILYEREKKKGINK